MSANTLDRFLHYSGGPIGCVNARPEGDFVCFGVGSEGQMVYYFQSGDQNAPAELLGDLQSAMASDHAALVVKAVAEGNRLRGSFCYVEVVCNDPHMPNRTVAMVYDLGNGIRQYYEVDSYNVPQWIKDLELSEGEVRRYVPKNNFDWQLIYCEKPDESSDES
jgi:hypothetical protein